MERSVNLRKKESTRIEPRILNEFEKKMKLALDNLEMLSNLRSKGFQCRISRVISLIREKRIEILQTNHSNKFPFEKMKKDELLDVLEELEEDLLIHGVI